jgi:SAM-dependent methyltransferase
VTHIDDGAIAAVGDLYEELAIDGEVLDLMSSWVSHFHTPPDRLTVLGMNGDELEANPAASARVVHDLNTEPTLPFADEAFDAAVCCVSVDYLVRPIEVFQDVGRVLRPGGPFVCTFSNRLFPTKAIRGWLATDDQEHCAIVATYFRRAGGWTDPVAELRTPLTQRGDPLYAVYAHRAYSSPVTDAQEGHMNHAPDPERADDADEDVEGHLRMTDDQLDSGMTPSDAISAARDKQRDPDA